MKIKTSHSPLYIIVEDGLIANFDLADGRMIPAVVVKSNDGDKTVENLVKLHVGTPPGDVEVNWGKPLSIFLRDKVWELTLKFSNPTECEFNIQFDLAKEYRLIDAIFISKSDCRTRIDWYFSRICSWCSTAYCIGKKCSFYAFSIPW